MVTELTTPEGGSTEARLTALAAAPAEAVEALADEILASSDVEVVRGPELATVPVRLPIPGQASSFVVGHAVVTICEVTVDGARGDAIVPGRATRQALSAAICDAEVERGGPREQTVQALVAEAERQHARQRADEAAAVAATRLDDEDEERA